ncbi:MAG TPA: TonB family protein [Gemmatimonadaceae bacterium]|nr:TonB family protein [Gemmatimonadaceae bacterium]
MRVIFCFAACTVMCAGAAPAQENFAGENGTSHAITVARSCDSQKTEMIDAQLMTGATTSDAVPADFLRRVDSGVFFYFSPVAWRTPRFAVAEFTLHRDGSVSGTHLTTPSGIADFDSAVTIAIGSAGKTKTFPAFPASITADTLVVTAFAGRHANGTAKPYLEKRTTCPAWPSPKNPQPEYPADMKQEQVRGFVRVQFMVDERGLPDSASMQVLQTSGDSFTNSVRAVLSSLRYEPASVQGTKVKQLTEQTFMFGFIDNLPQP